MPPRDRLHRQPGDGWVECRCGRRHWGLFGAAGLLLVRRGADGGASHVVLQHRATWSDQGGTWALPGGAVAPGETAVQGALREAHEEAGIDPSSGAVRGEHVLAHPDWTYTTVLADEAGHVTPAVTDAESTAVEWVPVDEVDQRPLLAAVADAWPELLTRISR